MTSQGAHAAPAPRTDGARLRDELLRFASRPARYAHPSWLPDWAAGLPAPLPERLERELSAWLLAEHGLDAHARAGLDGTAARLFMLDRAALRGVALALGVARHRTSLRRVVLRTQVDLLRAALGSACVALRSPWAEALPACGGPLGQAWQRWQPQAIRDVLQQDGEQALRALLDPADPAEAPAARRAALCLPRVPAGRPVAPLTAPQRAALAQTVAAHVVPLQAAPWTWLF